MKKIVLILMLGTIVLFLSKHAIAEDSSAGKFIIIEDMQIMEKSIVWPPPLKKHIGKGAVKGYPIRSGAYCNKKSCVYFITDRRDDGSLVVLLEDEVEIRKTKKREAKHGK